MFTADHLCLPLSVPTPSQPCSFKGMWFTDVPFMIATDCADNSVAITLRSTLSLYQFLRRRLVGMLLTKLQVILLLRVHSMNTGLLRSFYDNKLSLVVSIRSKVIHRASRKTLLPQKRPQTNLANLPMEIKLNIFRYLAQNTKMRVVGHSSGGRDSFYFKERGFMPILIINKQFYHELLDEYFKTVPIEIKSSSTSMFGGDMTGFGSENFRDRVRKLHIKDCDIDRRSRISSAFKHAKAEYSEKGALSSRKGAYYFTGY